MTDLTAVLPEFPTHQYVRLIPSLEKNKITTADLLTLDYVEVAKRAHLPLLDVKRLCGAVIAALQSDLGIRQVQDVETIVKPTLKSVGKDILACSTVSTLDDDLDRALGGGVPTGYITEITGERYNLLFHHRARTNKYKWCRQNSIPHHSSACCATTGSPWSFKSSSLYIHRVCNANQTTYSASSIPPSACKP
jgi:hypothetical protein